MKIKISLVVTMIFGLLSCNDKESNEINNLIFGVWTLETAMTNYETIDFKEDNTYKITAWINSPMINNNIPAMTAFVTGNWEYTSNKITFLTADIDLNSNNSDIDRPIVVEESIGSFWGNQEGINQDNASIDGINNFTGDKITLDSEYEPTVWIIEELSNNVLIVTSGSDRIEYIK